MKRIRLYREKGHYEYRTDPDYLNEVNIMIKLRQFMETLFLFDFFWFDYYLFIVTELCVFGDLQDFIKRRAIKQEYISEIDE